MINHNIDIIMLYKPKPRCLPAIAIYHGYRVSALVQPCYYFFIFILIIKIILLDAMSSKWNNLVDITIVTYR